MTTGIKKKQGGIGGHKWQERSSSSTLSDNRCTTIRNEAKWVSKELVMLWNVVARGGEVFSEAYNLSLSPSKFS